MHGGDIYGNEVKHDFSVNTNPLGMPGRVTRILKKSVELWSSYPDPFCRGLIDSLANILHVKNENLVLGNGASEIISAVIRAFNVRKAVILAPSFLGYKNALDAADAEAVHVPLEKKCGFAVDEDILEKIASAVEEHRPEILMVASPNNPNGKLVPPGMLEKIALCCRNAGTVFFLDECFFELADSCVKKSFISSINDFPNVVVLRAFTKSFAMAGLRLGYAAASGENILKIKRHLPEWNVSVPAQIAGVAALRERNHLEKSRLLVFREKKFLSDELKKIGFTVFESDANFILFSSEKNLGLKEKLLREKILIRDCSDYTGLGKGFYRIAVKKHRENKKLLEAIRNVCD